MLCVLIYNQQKSRGQASLILSINELQDSNT